MSSKIKLPKGWRLLEDKALIKEGDRFNFGEDGWTVGYPGTPVGGTGNCKIGITVAKAKLRSGSFGCRLMVIREIKRPANPKPRRESLTARIATAIQTGQNKPAMDTAREVMRILDNWQRAKRRKEGK